MYNEFPGDIADARPRGAGVRVVRGLEAVDRATRARSRSCRRGARAYLDRIEELVEAPITYVSVGTRRDQIIGIVDR